MAKKLSESACRKRVKSVLKPFRVTNGKAFRLGQVKPDPGCQVQEGRRHQARHVGDQPPGPAAASP